MALVGQIGSFNEKAEEWEDYMDRFKSFLTANSIEENKKVDTFLACVGPSIYK